MPGSRLESQTGEAEGNRFLSLSQEAHSLKLGSRKGPAVTLAFSGTGLGESGRGFPARGRGLEKGCIYEMEPGDSPSLSSKGMPQGTWLLLDIIHSDSASCPDPLPSPGDFLFKAGGRIPDLMPL